MIPSKLHVSTENTIRFNLILLIRRSIYDWMTCLFSDMFDFPGLSTLPLESVAIYFLYGCVIILFHLVFCSMIICAEDKACDTPKWL